ncbi:MAG: hypothetical protein ABI604_09730 [Nitrospirota bacterium]
MNTMVEGVRWQDTTATVTPGYRSEIKETHRIPPTDDQQQPKENNTSEF